MYDRIQLCTALFSWRKTSLTTTNIALGRHSGSNVWHFVCNITKQNVNLHNSSGKNWNNISTNPDESGNPLSVWSMAAVTFRTFVLLYDQKSRFWNCARAAEHETMLALRQASLLFVLCFIFLVLFFLHGSYNKFVCVCERMVCCRTIRINYTFGPVQFLLVCKFCRCLEIQFLARLPCWQKGEEGWWCTFVFAIT